MILDHGTPEIGKWRRTFSRAHENGDNAIHITLVRCLSDIRGVVMRKQMYASLLVIILHSVALAQTAQQSHLVITGQVLDDQGRPVSGALVSASPDGGLSGKLPTSPSDDYGQFAIVVSRTGGYKVTASKLDNGYPSSFNPFYNPSNDSPALVRVYVKETQATPFATVRLGPRAGKLVGRIVDAETDRPVMNTQINICRTEIPKYCHRVDAKLPDGQFETLVPSATIAILVSAPGYKDWNGAEGANRQPLTLQVASSETKVLSVSLEKLPARDEAANSSALEAPQTLSPIDGEEFSHYPRTTRLEWAQVPGAVSYTVELEFCQPGGVDRKECRDPRLLQMRGNPPLSGIEGTNYEFLFLGAQPGRWRVWAVDAKGQLGMKSAWSKFKYSR